MVFVSIDFVALQVHVPFDSISMERNKIGILFVL